MYGLTRSDLDNDLVEIINTVGNRINFVHFRNVEFMDERKFKEVAHPSL